MHVALLFPPGTDPRSPHLSLPALTAHLRGSGVRVTQRDLDIEGLLWLLEPGRLAEALERSRRRFDAMSRPERAESAGRIQLGEWAVDHIDQALADLRDPAAFVDPDRAHQARSCIGAATDMITMASERVTYSATNATYEVDGVNPARLSQLVAATADPDIHLFEALLRSSVLPDLERDRPDLVGISILNRQQVLPGLILARRLREAGHLVVLGGTVYAKFHEQLLSRSRFFETFCDALVPYEGETALLALVEAVAAGRPPTEWGSLPNTLALDSSGRVTAGPTMAEDIRSLPTPDFDGLPLDDYLNPVPVLPILTGKGCYFNRCKFCDIPYINRVAAKPYRMRGAEQIAGDVATLHARHGARHFEITDETLSPNLMLRLDEALEPHRHIEPRFVGYARLEPGFTPETCQRIHAMGMRKLFFGLESANQDVLDHMNKGIRVDVARTVLRNCVDAGLAVHLFNIVGFPEETEAQARDTLAFLLDEAPTLGPPRNTFDVHPFGLDLRTEYGDHPDRFGIEFDGDPIAGADFPITLRGWRNTRGLSADDAGELIDEFHETLRRAYPSRHFPDQQWLGFEEYSIIYGDVYDGAPFDWRLSLPDDGDPLRFGLRWAPHVQIQTVDDRSCVVHAFGGSVGLSPAALQLLGPVRPPASVDEHLTAIVATVDSDSDSDSDIRADVRHLLDGLLGVRALWLRPDGELPDVSFVRSAPSLAAP
jgi:hypothetical protein